MQVLSPTYELLYQSVATNPKEVTDRPPRIISFAISLTSPIAVDVCQRIAPDDLGDHDGRLAKGVLFADWAPSTDHRSVAWSLGNQGQLSLIDLSNDPKHDRDNNKNECHRSFHGFDVGMWKLKLRVGHPTEVAIVQSYSEMISFCKTTLCGNGMNYK